MLLRSVHYYFGITKKTFVHSALFLNANKNSSKSNQDTRLRVLKACSTSFRFTYFVFIENQKNQFETRDRVVLDKISDHVILLRKSLILNISTFLQIFCSGICFVHINLVFLNKYKTCFVQRYMYLQDHQFRKSGALLLFSIFPSQCLGHLL